MHRFTFERTINSDVESVFEVFSNHSNLEKLAPLHYLSVRTMSVRDKTAVAEVHMCLGTKEFVMMTRHVADRPRSHDVFVIGGDLKGSHFREQFTPTSDGTRVDVAVIFKLGMFGGLHAKKYAAHYGAILDDLAGACQD